MALRDQPYLPLYVQDIMTDEKLNECSAATHGIYIKGIMCLMHKSDEYGVILLKQKDKQTSNQIKNFALKLGKHLPYTIDEINDAIIELIEEGVLHFDKDNPDKLCQKRMIKDNKTSIARSNAGSIGGKKTHFAKANSKAKIEANSEYEYEDENVIKDVILLKETRFNKEVILQYFIDKDYSIDEGESFYNHYSAQGWVTGSGLPITNWKLKAENWHKEQTRRNADAKSKQSDSRGKGAIDFDKYEQLRKLQPK